LRSFPHEQGCRHVLKAARQLGHPSWDRFTQQRVVLGPELWLDQPDAVRGGDGDWHHTDAEWPGLDLTSEEHHKILEVLGAGDGPSHLQRNLESGNSVPAWR
jgi:hypothetical protein